MIGRQLKRRQHTKPVWQKPTPNNRNWPKLRYTLEARFYSLTRLHFYFSYACVITWILLQIDYVLFCRGNFYPRSENRFCCVTKLSNQWVKTVTINWNIVVPYFNEYPFNQLRVYSGRDTKWDVLCSVGYGGVLWPPAHPDGPDLCPVPVPVWGQSEVPAWLSVRRLCSQCLHVPHQHTNERGCLCVRTFYFLKVHTQLYHFCTLYIVGCRV